MAKCASQLAVAIAAVYIHLVVSREPINPDNLDPDFAHVCSSTVDEEYTQLETYTHYYQYKTHTWCASWSLRCTEYMLKSETKYRVVVKSRPVITYSCCSGYRSDPMISYCIPECQDDCHSATNHGSCVAPGFCLCKHGYRGDFCESSCRLGTWGQDCHGTCDCNPSYGSCDATNGNCICHIGYTGQDCSQQCQGSFGRHCQYPCACENGATCNNINGNCTCPPGYSGAYCHKRCDEGTFGHNCTNWCQCQNGATCHAETGACICGIGYTGDVCSEPCDDYHWGLDCQQTCSCNNGGSCDSQTGDCVCDLGFAGDSCQEICEPGYYGHDCQTKCRCENGGRCYYQGSGEVACNCTGTAYHGDNCTTRVCGVTQYMYGSGCVDCDCDWDTATSCDATSGQCICAAGYQGVQCNEPCDWPYYGTGCQQVCYCQHGDCDPVSGACLTCYPGYTGANCSEECPEGKWGLDCLHSCVCENGAECHHKSGYCTCAAGWKGLTCAQPCPTGTYGVDCSSDCTCDTTKSYCNPVDGSCHCLSGYYGNPCRQCPSMKFGFQCVSDCHCHVEGTYHCDHKTGECLCKPGWKGVSCNSRCNDGTWGEGCTKSCVCSNHGSCDQETGVCDCYAGYTGDLCETTCPAGKFGLGCAETCSDCVGGGTCDFATGICPVPTTCPAGFTGDHCEIPCPESNWGPDCVGECAPSCVLPQGVCSPITGVCHCYIGYTGPGCETACADGYYGSGCSYKCACVPEHTVSCGHQRGHCHCRPGYEGDFCENACGHQTWGPECRQNCSDICEHFVSCDHIRGAPCVCSPGYEGAFCQYVNEPLGPEHSVGAKSDTSPALIGGCVAAGVLLVLLVLLVLYYRRRIDRLKTENLRIQYNGQAADIVRENTPTPNGGPPGPLSLTNPLYVEENINNERRYPHLTAQLSLSRPTSLQVEPPQCNNCGDDCRPTSGLYSEPDEDRYATLNAIAENKRTHNGDAVCSEDVAIDTDYVAMCEGDVAKCNSGVATSNSETDGLPEHNTMHVIDQGINYINFENTPQSATDTDSTIAMATGELDFINDPVGDFDTAAAPPVVTSNLDKGGNAQATDEDTSTEENQTREIILQGDNLDHDQTSVVASPYNVHDLEIRSKKFKPRNNEVVHGGYLTPTSSGQSNTSNVSAQSDPSGWASAPGYITPSNSVNDLSDTRNISGQASVPGYITPSNSVNDQSHTSNVSGQASVPGYVTPSNSVNDQSYASNVSGQASVPGYITPSNSVNDQSHTSNVSGQASVSGYITPSNSVNDQSHTSNVSRPVFRVI